MFVAWILFGALFGYAASQRRGFSPAAGVLGGMLLGIAAPLMFFVTGDQKKCPACAEWVQKDATLCKHCRTPFVQSFTAPVNPKTSVIAWIALGLFAAFIGVLLALP